MTEICHSIFPSALRHARPLPGIAPLEPDGWITTDEVYAEQMARRVALLGSERAQVIATCAGSEAAQAEALEAALDVLRGREGFAVNAKDVICQDGRCVGLDGAPLEVIGQLIQEDICILQKPDGANEHVLTAGVMCFPASWTLTEKIGRPLTGVHYPVDEYDAQLAKRVQRLFDGVKAGRPLWRFNRLWYADAELFQPRAENAPRAPVSGQSYSYLRMEKQSLVRLPRSQAVVFSIHTYVLHRRSVPADVEQCLQY